MQMDEVEEATVPLSEAVRMCASAQKPDMFMEAIALFKLASAYTRLDNRKSASGPLFEAAANSFGQVGLVSGQNHSLRAAYIIYLEDGLLSDASRSLKQLIDGGAFGELPAHCMRILLREIEFLEVNTMLEFQFGDAFACGCGALLKGASNEDAANTLREGMKFEVLVEMRMQSSYTMRLRA